MSREVLFIKYIQIIYAFVYFFFTKITNSSEFYLDLSWLRVIVSEWVSLGFGLSGQITRKYTIHKTKMATPKSN